MSNMELNLMLYQPFLKCKKEASVTYVYDPVRKKYLLLQPEELVRQLLIVYLVQEKKITLNKIAVELGLKINEMQKRCDILIYDKDFKPFMIIECKAPSVDINDAVFFQAANYNLPLQVPFILLSNGISNFCAKLDYEKNSIEMLSVFPEQA